MLYEIREEFPVFNWKGGGRLGGYLILNKNAEKVDSRSIEL